MTKNDDKPPPKDKVRPKEKGNLPVAKKPPYTAYKVFYDNRLPLQAII